MDSFDKAVNNILKILNVQAGSDFRSIDNVVNSKIEEIKKSLGVRTFISRKNLTPGKVIQFTYDGEQKYALVVPRYESNKPCGYAPSNREGIASPLGVFDNPYSEVAPVVVRRLGLHCTFMFSDTSRRGALPSQRIT